jgi:hypothetical protein
MKLLMKALVAMLVGLTTPAAAQTKLNLSTGLDYSSGKFGTAQRTDVLVAPLGARVRHGNWTLRGSLPIVSVRGDATAIGQQVFVVIDDNGGLRSASSGGSGSSSGSLSETSSGSNKSGSRRSSSGGSGGSGSGSSGGSGSGSSGSGGSGSSGSGSGSSGSGSSGSSGSTGGSGATTGAGAGTTTGTTTTVATAQPRRVTNTGIGDMSLSATYTFDEPVGEGTYIDLTGRVRLPTGDESKGLSLGVTDYAAVAEVGVDRDHGGVYLSGGRRFLADADAFQRVDGWQASLGGWLGAGAKTTVGAYVDWRESSTGFGDDPTEAGAYVSYKISDRLRIGASANAGLNEASPDVGVGVSVSWRASDRPGRK